MRHFFKKLSTSVLAAYRAFKEPWKAQAQNLVVSPNPLKASQTFDEQKKIQNVAIARHTPNAPEAILQNRPSPRSEDSFTLELWSQLDSFIRVQNSPQTKRAYQKDLKAFFEFLETSGKKMSVHTLVEYRELLATSPSKKTGIPLSHVSVNRKMASIKSFLNWLVLNGILPNNPARAVKSFRAGRESTTRDIPNDRVQVMLDLPRRGKKSGSLHHAILSTLFHLGLRRSELVQLRTSDIFEQSGMHVIRVKGKGDMERILPLHPQAYKSILNHLGLSKKSLLIDAPLFSPSKNNVTRDLTKAMDAASLSYIVKRYAKMAGVTYRVSPHSARATAVSNALDHAAPHRAVQHMAGWSSPLMVSRYDKRKSDLKNSAIQFIQYDDSKN